MPGMMSKNRFPWETLRQVASSNKLTSLWGYRLEVSPLLSCIQMKGCRATGIKTICLFKIFWMWFIKIIWCDLVKPVQFSRVEELLRVEKQEKELPNPVTWFDLVKPVFFSRWGTPSSWETGNGTAEPSSFTENSFSTTSEVTAQLNKIEL